MKSLALAAAIAAVSLIPGSARAQQVSAVIVIGRPPVLVERARPRYYDHGYRVAPRRVYVEQRYPRVIYVHRIHGRFRNHSRFHAVRAWYDSRRDAYYDGYRDGLREVRVYQDHDRYYRYDDDDHDRD